MYDETVLLKLRRDYAKDEVVMFALNKIQELQIENGKLTFYVSELEDGKDGIKDRLLNEALERNQKLSDEIHAVRVNLKCIEQRDKNVNKEHVFRKLKEKNEELNRACRSYKEKNIDMNYKLNILLTNPEHFNKKTLDEKVEFLKNMELVEI